MTDAPHTTAQESGERPSGRSGQADGKPRASAGDPAQARTSAGDPVQARASAGDPVQAERRTDRAAERAAERAARREARRQAAAGETASEDQSQAHGEAAATPPEPPTLADIVGKLPPLPRPKLPKLPRLRRPRLRLLPAMMFAAVIMLGVRVGDLWDAMIVGPAGLALVEPSPAWAESEEPAPAGPETMDLAAAEDAATARPDDAAGRDNAQGPGGAEGPGGLSLEPEEMTAGELELLQNLSERREALEAREQALDERAALLTVAERRIDEKMAELTALRAQLEGMMGMVDEEQEARLARLVSMYEAMRPTDAADIFNGLDMGVLIDVLQRMREQKSAPILAAMEPERARMVTAELVMRRELPELPDAQ